MRRAALAKKLINAPADSHRRQLLARFPNLADEKLAAELRKACYAAWTVEPGQAQRAAASARVLAGKRPTPYIKATAAWLRGISEITQGRFERAVNALDEAASELRDKTDAAQVQVARLLALAMLSRYDEAMSAGKKALKVFVAVDDQLAAGKIEMNLSNIVARQGRHRDSEKFGLSALRRFIRSDEQSWRAMAENSLANTYADLNALSQAEKYYRRALETARSQKMDVTVAEVEASLGNLAAMRGRYADALRYLESSRQRYDELAMPHQSAIADLEIADIYLELNLLAESIEVLSRIAPIFHRLKMRAEEARARLDHGRAAAKLRDWQAAKREFTLALKLFTAEKNIPAQASVLLSQAELAIAAGRITEATATLGQARSLIRRAENRRQNVQHDLLLGAALLAVGNSTKAKVHLVDAANAAKKHVQPEALHTAYELLGRLAASKGDRGEAKRSFARAIDIIERLRSPLGAGEFGMAFFGSRLGPYEDLARLRLDEEDVAHAFATIERGRSRGLLDALGRKARRSAAADKLAGRAAELRSELNARYKSLEHAGDDSELLRVQIRRAESDLTKINRQVASLTTDRRNAGGHVFDLAEIQAALGGRTLIEFVEFDGDFSAFIITKDRSPYIEGLGTTAEITRLLEALHFQFGAMRYGRTMSRFAVQLKGRTDGVLMRLYDTLIGPLRAELETEKLVIVPVGPLHYVPFAALHDGDRYLAEQYEITSAPSAAVWRELQQLKGGNIRSSLLIAHADERIPLVENEVAALSSVAPGPKVLAGENATFEAFRTRVGGYDLIHLACHGQFRPDNPMFSSLHLADGWITVQDLTSQRLKAKLVTLSACETGLGSVFAGDELLGLARGFLAAGAATLVASLWTVNDEAASQLMEAFYITLQRGATPAASLRDAQAQMISRGLHPYLWAPFFVIGR